jgi:predicted transcriptional regulator
MTQDKEATRERTALLKKLRDERKDSIERTRALLKTQQETRRKICQAMRHGAETVPEVAEASGLPAHQVLWHITALRKYDLVVETGKCGEYYRYAMVQEVAE